MSDKPTYEELEQRIKDLEMLESEHQKKEEQRKLEAQLAKAMEMAQLGHWEYNVAKDLFTFNDQFYKIFRTTATKVGGYQMSSAEYTRRFVHPEDRYLVGKEIRKAIEASDSNLCRQIEHRIIFSDGKNGYISVKFYIVKDVQGKTIRTYGVNQDITDRKRAEEALENRMIALTRPLDDPGAITFQALFNLDDIQRLQDQFSEATGVASIITNTEGTPITKPSNFCRLCKDIIRKTEKGRINCYKSDAVLGKSSTEGPTIQPCLSGGLWDAGAGITVGGKHIANWLIGQVRDKTQTDEKMRAYAREIGADEDSVIEAFHEVNSMSREQFEDISRMLFTLANQLSSVAYKNVQQARLITELRNAENALKESKTFLENMSDIAYRTDDQGTLIWVNSSVKRITGFSPEEIIGKSFLPLFIEDDHDSLIAVYKRTLAGESLENTFTFTSGATCHFTSLPNRNDKGEIIGMFGVARDITDRLNVEKALQVSEDRLKKAQVTAKIGNWEYDVATGRVWASEEAFRIFGIERTSEYLPLDEVENCIVEAERTNQALVDLITKGVGYDIEYQVIPKNTQQRITIHSIAEIVKDKEGNPLKVLGVIQDITESKAKEKENLELVNQLQQVQKMETVGRLAGGVAHDFNNILGIIRGHAELALEDVDQEHKLFGHLQEILNASDRSADLTRQLLAFARKQTISPKEINLNDTVEGMLKMLQRLIGEDINLAWLPSKKMWLVKMDPSQVDQILVNLCVNARDAIGGVGKITIETETVTFDDRYCIDHKGFLPGEFVMITVSDDGAGIEKNMLDQIFEPFFTTKELGKGTGLGLSTVYGIVKQNSGFINAYSEIGQGTTFKVYVPRYIGKTKHILEKVLPETANKGHETILLVEDEPAFLDVTKSMLERLGYSVIAASMPGEAIRLAHEHPGEIHLLMTDVVMPEMNGRDLAKNLLSVFPDIKRLFMSGYTSNVIAHHGILDEGVQFIHKPFSKQDLASKLREVLGERLSPS